jgi:ParB/RepB/Spo0J family partition protein
MSGKHAPRGLDGSITVLGSLDETQVADHHTATLQTLSIHDITGHPDNPRTALGDLSELTASIREFGVLQPPIVIQVSEFVHAWPHHREAVAGHAWVVVAGHRRHAAAGLAGLDTLDVVVRADLATPEAAAAAFVVENMHRAALAPLEEARAYALLADLGLGQRDIARRTGVSQSHVSKRLALLRLPQQAQDALTAAVLPISEALGKPRETRRRSGETPTEPHHRRPGGDGDETARRQAAQARAVACRRLVATAPTPEEALTDLVRVSLDGSPEHPAALRLTHAWLRGAGLGAETDDPARWLESIRTTTAHTRTWVAWALTVARDETRAAAIHQAWGVDTRRHLRRLTQRVGYQPSPWEYARSSPDGDSGGISPLGPAQ